MKLKQSTSHSITLLSLATTKKCQQPEAAYLVKNVDMKVTIEGHADERGTPEYNIAILASVVHKL